MEMYSNFPIGDLMDTLPDGYVARLMQEGLEAENQILAISALEALIRRGGNGVIIDALIESTQEGHFTPGSRLSDFIPGVIFIMCDKHSPLYPIGLMCAKVASLENATDWLLDELYSAKYLLQKRLAHQPTPNNNSEEPSAPR